MNYNSRKTEQKWQRIWADRKLFQTDLQNTKKKFYSLVMFPYPSGDRLHIGHWYNFAPADSYARYTRMRGYNVFEPMGYDSFGLPAENYAIKTGTPPAESTDKNIKFMRRQLSEMGAMYDWSSELATSAPEYYEWTQWVFLQLYKKGLAYKKKAPVNWCPSCQTVLANEQVQDGTCERCDTEVTKKELVQWFFRIRDYAEDLLKHENLNWPENTLLMQKNWIGRSEGANVLWKVDGKDITLGTFTTTIDTIYGVTFAVISPEHPELPNLVTGENKKKVDKYVEAAQKKSELERMATDDIKTGVFTGSYLLHPFNGKRVALWVADYVLMNYGTGVVMGVPAHDQRDQDFAKKYGIPVVQTCALTNGETFVYDNVDKYNVKGKLVNSDKYTGMSILEARKKMTDDLAKEKKAEHKIEYKLRDWLISRQRYWGAPIPIINCKKCGEVSVPEKDLPVLLPEKGVDYKPRGTSPLATVSDFVQTKCPKCGGKAKREVDTMDTFVCSSWYFLRYLSPHDAAQAFDKNLVKKWLPVDLYIGGPEHACMHLLYARFIHKVLMDDRVCEPFKKLVHQGLITKDGAKMSKSKGNVVAPDSFVEKYGSDVFRMYLMFMGPFTEGGDWNDKGIGGIARFVERVWNIMTAKHVEKDSDEILRVLHGTIKKVSEDIEIFHFNTAIAAMMELINAVSKRTDNFLFGRGPTNFGGLTLESKKLFARILAPLAPHLAEEIWEHLGESESIFNSVWPKFEEKYLKASEFELVLQINGRVRSRVQAKIGISKEEALELALQQPNLEVYLTGKKRIKEIFVPDKLLNIVVK